MPKEADYTIRWSQTIQGYEIVHTPFSFPLTTPATLQHWLGMVNTCRFCSATGHTFTLQKERKQRGGAYWYAYKRVNGKLQKKYLGDTSKLDIPTLEQLARQFAGQDAHEPEPPPTTARQRSQAQAQESPPVPPSSPPRQPTLRFTHTLTSALAIYGFSSIPTRKQLIVRYRELSKQHHPDTGGLHQDMVAVNLAYGYLKKFVDDREG